MRECQKRAARRKGCSGQLCPQSQRLRSTQSSFWWDGDQGVPSEVALEVSLGWFLFILLLGVAGRNLAAGAKA